MKIKTEESPMKTSLVDVESPLFHPLFISQLYIIYISSACMHEKSSKSIIYFIYFFDIYIFQSYISQLSIIYISSTCMHEKSSKL